MPEITEDQALDVLRQAYWDDVRGVAENLEEEIKAGNIEDREAAEDWLHETVDGHSRVIYTREAILCLLFSPNENEAVEISGGDIFEQSNDIPFSSLAFYAFRQDVMEQAEDILRRLDDGEYAEDDEEDEEEDSEDE